jgi:hypothetical protein
MASSTVGSRNKPPLGGNPMPNLDELQSRWERNEIELRRLANTPGVDRELNAARIDELLAEQNQIEDELGSILPDNSRRWPSLL